MGRGRSELGEIYETRVTTENRGLHPCRPSSKGKENRGLLRRKPASLAVCTGRSGLEEIYETRVTTENHGLHPCHPSSKGEENRGLLGAIRVGRDLRYTGYDRESRSARGDPGRARFTIHGLRPRITVCTRATHRPEVKRIAVCTGAIRVGADLRNTGYDRESRSAPVPPLVQK